MARSDHLSPERLRAAVGRAQVRLITRSGDQPAAAPPIPAGMNTNLDPAELERRLEAYLLIARRIRTA